jgi:RNA polymerase sigma factor (sigma-70 family)
VIDPALRLLQGATDADQAQRELASLVETRVKPLVSKIVARKLSGQGPNRAFRAEDVEDVIADAILVLVKRLQRLREDRDAAAIERLDDYTAVVAYSACAHHLRQRFPERSRLKNRLRYVLEHDRRFALWTVPDAGLYCGFAQWRETAPSAAIRERLAALEGAPERWPATWGRAANGTTGALARMLDAIFERSEGPVDLDDLTELVATIWHLDRRPQEPGESSIDRLAGTQIGPEEAIDQRRAAARLWAEIQQLPVRQRVALLLNLRDGQGAGLLWILPTTGVASIRAIASALEMPAEELAALWRGLPLDDNAIAAKLGCSRQQVINLRMAARKRLSNRLGNLAGRSASRIDT